MDLRFAAPELHTLDQLGTEILVAGIAEDERPPRGAAGLVDWRCCQRLSHLLKQGFASGRLGEVLLMPVRPRLPFDKAVLFGLGVRAQFDASIFTAILEHILRTLRDLRARSVVVELPGRHFDAISPEHATRLLTELLRGATDQDAWTVLETPDAQRMIQRRGIQEGRILRPEGLFGGGG